MAGQSPTRSGRARPARNPGSAISSISVARSSSRSTIFSPNSVGRQETRKSISFERPCSMNRSLMRPSCGSRLSAMSSLAMIFRRDAIASLNFIGGDMTPWRIPSMRKRTRNSFSYGFEMDVARPLLDGGHEHQVDQPDHRRVSAVRPGSASTLWQVDGRTAVLKVEDERGLVPGANRHRSNSPSSVRTRVHAPPGRQK